MFRGNYDIYHTVAQKIIPAIKARYFRIHPKGWRSYIAMRVELYGGRLRGDYIKCTTKTFQILALKEGTKNKPTYLIITKLDKANKRAIKCFI